MAGKIEKTEQALTDSVTQAEQALAVLNDVVEGEEGAGGLPEGWVLTDLAKIGAIVTGKTPTKKNPEYFNGDIPFIKPGDINDQGYIYSTADTVSELGAATVPTIPKDSIVVTCIGNLGRVGITYVTSATNQQINAVIPSEKISSKYLYYVARTLKDWMEIESSATTVAIINKSKFSMAPVPLPPLAEQTVIAQTLDTLLAQVDNIKIRLDAIPKILKTFRQSVLAAAVSGKLTEAWRGENECERSFKTLGDAGVSVKTGPFGSALHKADYIEGGVPVINPMHINDGLISPSSSMTVKDEKYEDLKAWHLKVGDVIVGRRGEMGRAAVFTSDDKMLCGTGSMVLRGDDNVSSEYLCIILRSPTAIEYFVQGSVGSTMVNLNQKIIKALDVYFPPIEEQAEIVRRVEELFAFADQIEQQVKNAQGRVNNLTQSILAKAFRGELTTQWRAENPNLISGDNSAEALLAKIKEERENLKPKKSVKNKSNAKTE